MCASYGLGGGPHGLDLSFDLPPMHEPDSRKLVAEWAAGEGNRAKITGRKAMNLNPIIRVYDGQRITELAWWWLHVGGQPARFSAFNSRDDSLVRKWRAPFQHRALLPANWYIEKGRTFAAPRDETFAIAAITAPVSRGDESHLLSYSMVTRDPVGQARDVHNRMPLVLPGEFHETWLDPERAGDDGLVAEALAASEKLAMAMFVIDEPRPGVLGAPTLF